MTNDALARFEEEVARTEREAGQLYEAPEFALTLDLEKRAGDVRRIARHLHQMCAGHADHFRRSNFVKLAYLGRFFLTEADAKNALGVTAAARCLLELDAFLRYVHAPLTRAAAGSATEWQRRGRDFFEAILRARYATGDPSKRAVLIQVGVPEDWIRPPRVSECIAELERSGAQMRWVREHYAVLCDWVHASLSSQTVSTAGGRMGSMISEGEGAMLLKQETMINAHQYAREVTVRPVLQLALPRARKNFADALEAINSMPQTPFTREELIRLTGNEFGVEVLRPPRVTRPTN